jgi:hypothetical protein
MLSAIDRLTISPDGQDWRTSCPWGGNPATVALATRMRHHVTRQTTYDEFTLYAERIGVTGKNQPFNVPHPLHNGRLFSANWFTAWRIAQCGDHALGLVAEAIDATPDKRLDLTKTMPTPAHDAALLVLMTVLDIVRADGPKWSESRP